MKSFETHGAADLFRIGVLFGAPCLILLSAAWFSLFARDLISGQILVLLLLLNVPITLGGVFIIFFVVRTGAVGVAHMVTAAGDIPPPPSYPQRSEEHTSELQSQSNLVCRLLLEKKKTLYVPTGVNSTQSHSLFRTFRHILST